MCFKKMDKLESLSKIFFSVSQSFGQFHGFQKLRGNKKSFCCQRMDFAVKLIG